MNLPFEDSFNLRPRPEWEPATGTWRVVDGWYTGGGNAEWIMTLVGDERWTDYALDVDVRFLWTSPIRLIVRASRSGYVAIEVDCCDINLLLVANGESGTFAHSDESGLRGGAGWDENHFRVEVRDDIFTVYRDGTRLIQAQDPTLRSGRVGVAFLNPNTYMPRFDNVHVSRLD